MTQGFKGIVHLQMLFIHFHVIPNLFFLIFPLWTIYFVLVVNTIGVQSLFYNIFPFSPEQVKQSGYFSLLFKVTYALLVYLSSGDI